MSEELDLRAEIVRKEAEVQKWRAGYEKLTRGRVNLLGQIDVLHQKIRSLDGTVRAQQQEIARLKAQIAALAPRAEAGAAEGMGMKSKPIRLTKMIRERNGWGDFYGLPVPWHISPEDIQSVEQP